MLRPALRAVAPRWPRGLLARAMSSKLVATVTGPADKDALSTFTRTVMGQGAKLGGSRSIEVSGTVSIASVLYMPDKLAEKDAIESVTALQWALQANLAGYIVTVRPGRVGTYIADAWHNLNVLWWKVAHHCRVQAATV